jgi:hypothetical protein
MFHFLFFKFRVIIKLHRNFRRNFHSFIKTMSVKHVCNLSAFFVFFVLPACFQLFVSVCLATKLPDEHYPGNCICRGDQSHGRQDRLTSPSLLFLLWGSCAKQNCRTEDSDYTNHGETLRGHVQQDFDRNGLPCYETSTNMAFVGCTLRYVTCLKFLSSLKPRQEIF